MTRPRLLLVLLLAAALAGTTHARGFRDLAPIATPDARPADAVPLERFVPVDRALVERAVHAVAEAWNSGRLSPLLSPDFANRSRLTDVIREVVPSDATLRVLAIEAVSTLDQYRRDPPDGPARRVSTVSVIARTQVEFNDPRTGFQRLEGRNELIFRLRQPLTGTGSP